MTSNRERFEEWYLAEFWEGSNGGRAMLKIEPCGGYTYAKPQELWKVWQAAQPAGGEPVATKPGNYDAFYAGLYHKSSPMWRQLHELAVSKGYDHVRYAIECAPVYKCDCRGARKVGIDLEGRTRPCECVEAANDTAPPAAAHGDEAVLWELLEALRTATDRQALPGEFIRVMWEAGCDWINARAAIRAQGDDRLLFTDAIMPGGLTET